MNRPCHAASPAAVAPRRRQAGFSLIELLVALVITVMVILAVLALFDFNSKLTRVQTNVADMQQSLRIAQYDMTRLVRMAGRGGLPALATGSFPATFPIGTAVAVRNAVGPSQRLLSSDPETAIVEGSDVLTVRGTFATPIYEINTNNQLSFRLSYNGAPPTDPDPARAIGGIIEVCNSTPSGVAHDLKPLIERVPPFNAGESPQPEALVLVSPLDDAIYAVVELDPNGSSENAPSCAPAGGVTLAFRVVGGIHTDAYRMLSSTPALQNLPSGLSRAALVAVVEEYRFYVRDVPTADGEREQRLARAQFFPGTDIAYAGDDQNLRVDIADNILDLQVALGIETGDIDLVVSESTANRANDEWLLNAAGEGTITGDFFYARINTLARTDRPDRDYRAPLLTRIEDRNYSTTNPNDPVNGELPRMFRRRLLQTIVDLRNL